MAGEAGVAGVAGSALLGSLFVWAMVMPAVTTRLMIRCAGRYTVVPVEVFQIARDVVLDDAGALPRLVKILFKNAICCADNGRASCSKPSYGDESTRDWRLESQAA